LFEVTRWVAGSQPIRVQWLTNQGFSQHKLVLLFVVVDAAERRSGGG